MHIQTLVVGPFQANCYLLEFPQSGNVLLIDPGDESEVITARLSSRKADPTMALLTHGHLDHIAGLSGLIRHYRLPILLHSADLALYQKLKEQGRWFGLTFSDPPPVTRCLEDGEEIVSDPIRLRVLHTPGHSPGGVCYSIPEEKLLFSGDTLFAGSIGRSDLEGGDEELLLSSIRQKILSLPDETRVFPGHGPETTVGRERRNNPYLRD